MMEKLIQIPAYSTVNNEPGKTYLLRITANAEKRKQNWISCNTFTSLSTLFKSFEKLHKIVYKWKS
jgi:hypothetical protein